VNGFAELKADGSTACGCWIYSGVFGRDGVNKANSRKPKGYLGHGWGFSWPSDRRIIYNRASARPDGSPWSERKKLVWWDSEKWFTRGENRFAPPGDARFPFVLTTYRLTEHHTAGGMSRFLSHLAELQPEMFAEISPELATQLKIDNGDYICVVTLRGAIEARALVSRRIRPLRINGKEVHQVALPYHYGTAGVVRGGAANDLLTVSGEPNVTIME